MEFYTLIQTLKHLHSQSKMNARHTRWMDYIQQFEFLIKHKAGAQNKVADALSRRPHLLQISLVTINGFEHLTEEYTSDEDFSKIWNDLSSLGMQNQNDYMLRKGFLFFRSCLCIRRGSFREFLISELHGGGLAGHFR